MEKEWKLIGHFGVDSGMVIICDPCYLKYWKDNAYVGGEPTGEFSYDGAGRATGKILNAGELTINATTAVVTSTGRGDGTYPVYGQFKNGRVINVFISFDNTIPGEKMEPEELKEVKDVKVMKANELLDEWDTNDMESDIDWDRLEERENEIGNRYPFDVIFEKLNSLKEQTNAMRQFIADSDLCVTKTIKDVTQKVD